MMVGYYAIDYDGKCYRMWDPKNARFHETRDIIWLKPCSFRNKCDQWTLLWTPSEFVTPDSYSRGECTEEETESDNEPKRILLLR